LHYWQNVDKFHFDELDVQLQPIVIKALNKLPKDVSDWVSEYVVFVSSKDNIFMNLKDY
jgi:hypothetical protein